MQLTKMDKDCAVPRLPVDGEFIHFNDWNISYEKSHMLRSICKQGSTKCCDKDDVGRCELCLYQHSLDLPHLPDMVFHKNKLVMQHKDGALMEFQSMDALALVDTRPEQTIKKFKPFDWTFTSTYQGTMYEKIRSESTDMTFNKLKLMQRENIILYTDLTLFEDELHDHGISVMSVRIRVMPSGFFIVLRMKKL